MKKLIFVVIALFMLNNCGYTKEHQDNFDKDKLNI